MKTLILAAALAAVPGSVCAQTAPAQNTAAAVQETGQTAPPATVIKVDKIATASSVENREPVNETTAFDKTTGRVYAWTKVTATGTPVKIKHVYYAEGKKMAEVELNVNAASYRVWSSKAVWPGNWKVEATDESGAVLASTVFTVSAGATAEPVKPEPPTQGK